MTYDYDSNGRRRKIARWRGVNKSSAMCSSAIGAGGDLHVFVDGVDVPRSAHVGAITADLT